MLKQGLTQLFFESAERQPAAIFLTLAPQGA
jgi:hypothetical protein